MIKKLISILLCCVLCGGIGVKNNSLSAGQEKAEGLENSAINIYDMTVEYSENPISVDNTSPRFGWKLETNARGEYQSAYRIIVGNSEIDVRNDTGDFWDTGKIDSSESIDIIYSGKALLSGQKYFWKVKSWDSNGKLSDSQTESFSMGLLKSGDWKGNWIGYDNQVEIHPFSLEGVKWIWCNGEPIKGDDNGAVRYFRKKITLVNVEQLQKAIYCGTADGSFVLYINGKEAAKSNSWKKGAYVDIKQYLVNGENVIGIKAIDDGGYRGVIAALQLIYATGGLITISTDASFKSSKTEVVGWNGTAFNDSDWGNANVLGSYPMDPWGNINVPRPEQLPNEAAPLLRKEFNVEKSITSAKLYISGIGINYAYINGNKVGEAVLDPSNTNYNKTVLYSTYDVTGMLGSGINAIGVELGRGFYDIYEKTPWKWNEASWRDNPKLMLQMNINYSDGTSTQVVSDNSWKYTMKGPTVYNSIYFGETYDARKEEAVKGWNTPGFVTDSSWKMTDIMDAPLGKLTSQMMPQMNVIASYKPVSVKKVGSRYIFDFGRQLAGWPKFNFTGIPESTILNISSSEKLVDGEIADWNLNGSYGLPCTDIYITKGAEKEVFAPKYNYKGFRYIAVDGVPSDVKLTLNNIIGEEVRTDVKKTGFFNSSNSLINKIHDNMVITVANNLHGKPTDTPTFEKNGWTGDANVSLESMMLNFDMTLFLEKYYKDITDVMKNGDLPQIAPTDTWGYGHETVWNSISVNLPYELYRYTGNKSFVKNNYKFISDYANFEIAQLDSNNLSESKMGDWCAPGVDIRKIGCLPPEGPEVSGNAYGYNALKVAATLSNLVGNNGNYERFNEYADKVKNGLNEKYLKDNEYVTSRKSYELHDGTVLPVGYRQTSNILPLAFNMLPNDEAKDKVVNKLIAEINKNNDPHLDTGIAGTKYLFSALTDLGYGEIAYKIATQTTYPSYGYLIANGADSIYETWETNARSYQHYFLGTVDEWFYKYLAGINQFDNGFKNITFKPHVLGDLKNASAILDTPRGKVSIEWVRSGDTVEVNISVPLGSKAIVYIPAKEDAAVSERGKMKNVKFIGSEAGYRIYSVSSGEYQFCSQI